MAEKISYKEMVLRNQSLDLFSDEMVKEEEDHL